jgi:hypothetical protein
LDIVAETESTQGYFDWLRRSSRWVQRAGQNAITKTITAITTNDTMPWMKLKLGASRATNHPVTVPEMRSNPRTMRLATRASDGPADPRQAQRRSRAMSLIWRRLAPNTPVSLRPFLAAASARLDRRARDATVGTEHATVAQAGFEPHAAALAVIEKLAGIGRHAFGFLMAAARAGDLGFQNHALGPLFSNWDPLLLNPRGYLRP